MPTLTIDASIPAGAVVRAYDRHDNTFIGEAVSDGSGVTIIETSYPVHVDFIDVRAHEDAEVNPDITPTRIILE